MSLEPDGKKSQGEMSETHSSMLSMLTKNQMIILFGTIRLSFFHKVLTGTVSHRAPLCSFLRCLELGLVVAGSCYQFLNERQCQQALRQRGWIPRSLSFPSLTASGSTPLPQLLVDCSLLSAEYGQHQYISKKRIMGKNVGLHFPFNVCNLVLSSTFCNTVIKFTHMATKIKTIFHIVLEA